MPSRIDIGPEGGPFVAINENSNNLELQDINGNVIAKWDETAGQWDLNNNSLTGINAINASSANVEEASFDGNDVGFVGKSIDHDVTIEAGVLQFDNFSPSIEEGEIYVFEFSANRPGEGSVELRFNGDPDGNGDYAYFDESGSKVSNQDGVELFEATSTFAAVGGVFYVGFTDSRRPSVSPVPLFRFDDWNGFSQGGSADRDSDEITSIDIMFPEQDDNQVQMTKFYQRMDL